MPAGSATLMHLAMLAAKRKEIQLAPQERALHFHLDSASLKVGKGQCWHGHGVNRRLLVPANQLNTLHLRSCPSSPDAVLPLASWQGLAHGLKCFRQGPSLESPGEILETHQQSKYKPGSNPAHSANSNGRWIRWQGQAQRCKQAHVKSKNGHTKMHQS